MKVALVDTNRSTGVANSGLLRIGAKHRHDGDEVRLFERTLPRPGWADTIKLSTIFSFDAMRAREMASECVGLTNGAVVVGGVSASSMPGFFKSDGVDVHVGFDYEAEPHALDYSLLGKRPKYSVLRTSRGCPRKCGFCVVPKVEGAFVDGDGDWEKDVFFDGRPLPAQFYDNNFLAKPIASVEKDIERIKRLQLDKKMGAIDFNQALDGRLFTDNIARLFSGVRFSYLRFAVDGRKDTDPVIGAIESVASAGVSKAVTVYALYNFNDSPGDLYYRMAELAKCADKSAVQVHLFPMRYRPVCSVLPSSEKFVSRKWGKARLRGFMQLLSKMGPSGLIPLSTKMVRFWFGDSEDSFSRLISYPKIAKLSAQRKMIWAKSLAGAGDA